MKSLKFTIYGTLDGLNEYTRANRGNRYSGNRAKRRNQVMVYQALYGIREKFDEPVHITFTWYEPNRRRDMDNIAFAKKFILDALVSSGVLRGDGWKYITGFTDEFRVSRDKPRIEVEIEEAGSHEE